MSTRWIAFLVVSALPCLASAQSPPPPVPAASIPSSEGPVYKIELMIVDGLEAPVDQVSSVPRDLVPPASETQATFADPREGEAALARSAPPKTIAEALQSTEATDAARSLPPLDSVSGEIISPAPPRLTSKDDKWDALRDQIAADPEAEIISAPTIVVVEKQEATVYVASQAAFEYFVPLGEGKFEVRKTEPQELGIRLTVVVNPADDPEGAVLSPLQVEVTSLDGREPVKGLGLDVGKPIVSTRSIKTSLPIRFGEERMFPIPSVPNKAAAVIVRVERGEPETLNPRTTAPTPSASKER